MSKHMQLTISVRSYYKEGLKGNYPKIAQGLSYVHEPWVEEGPSLLDIVGRLDKLLYELEGNPTFRKILLKHKDDLHKLHKEVEEHIADWELAKADKVLYQMEDIFDQIEWELG
jgi:hypothetical protein